MIACLPLLALLSAAIVRAMIGIGVLDQPGARSSHLRPTPKGGGVGIVAATLAGLLLFGAGPPLLWLGAAGLGIALVSWLDDVRSLPFTVKLAAQALAAAVAAWGGALVTSLPVPLVGDVSLGWLAWPLTLLWIVAITNAVNFMDGLNGLAAGSVGLACLVLAWFAAWPVAVGCLSMAAGIAGFLPFNYPRARIFMGDVGSQFCGLMVAGLGLLAAREGQVTVLAMPVLLAGLLIDVAFTLVRRARARDRLAEAHRSHLYQVAHRSGMDAAWISVVEWGFVAWGALVCVVIAAAGSRWALIAALLVVVPQVAWIAVVIKRSRRVGLGRW